ncbi:MAG: hypothetical protein JXA37_07830, partial [Chloroflexia bacterium]|nr:hypothetical protein [Chloroflexia bacterium]
MHRGHRSRRRQIWFFALALLLLLLCGGWLLARWPDLPAGFFPLPALLFSSLSLLFALSGNRVIPYGTHSMVGIIN